MQRKKIKQIESNLKTQAVIRKERMLVLRIGLILMFFAIGYFTYYVVAEHAGEIRTNFSVNDQIPENHICMVASSVKSKETLPLVIDGKMYYGCCSSCLYKLEKNINNVRMANDLVSHKQIDKSKAFIGIDPMNPGKIVFFESEDNYKKYVQSKEMNDEE